MPANGPLTLGSLAPNLTPALKAKAAPAVSRIGGLGPRLPASAARSTARPLKQKQAARPASTVAALQAADAPVMAELDQSLAQSSAQEAQITRAIQQAAQATQRQRLISVNRAQVFKVTVPIMVGLAAILGRRAGMQGVLSALGGGLAGLQSGMNQQYQRAYRQYQAHSKALLDSAADLQKQYHAVMQDRDKTLTAKATLADNLTKQVADLTKAGQAAQAKLKALRISGGDNITRANIEAGARLDVANAKMRLLGNAASAAARAHLLEQASNLKPTPATLAAIQKALPGASLTEASQIAEIHAGLRALHGQPASSGFGETLAKLRTLHLTTPAEIAGEAASVRSQEGAALAYDQVLAAGAGGKRTTSTSTPTPGTVGNTGLSPGAIQLGAETFIEGKNLNNVVGYGEHSNAARHAAMNEAAAILHTGGYTLGDLPMLQSSFEARQKALGDVAAKGQMIATYVQSLHANVAKLRTAAQAFGPGHFPALNWAKIKAQQWSGDPQAVAYQQALFDVVIDYGRVLSGSTGSAATTDAAMKNAGDRLASSSSLPQLDASIQQIQQAAGNLDAAFTARAGSLRNSLNVLNLGQPVHGGATPGYTGPGGKRYSAAQVQATAAQFGLTPAEFVQQAGLKPAGE